MSLPFIIFVTDLMAATLSYLLGYYIRLNIPPNVEMLWSAVAVKIAIYAVVIILSGYFCDLFGRDKTMPSSELAARIAVTMMIAFFSLSAISFAAPELFTGRGVLSLSLLLCGVMFYLIHRTYQTICQLPAFAQNILILGIGPMAETIKSTITFSPYNYVFAGFVEPPNGHEVSPDERVVGHVNQIEELVHKGNIHKLVVSIAERRGVLPVRELLSCKLRGVEIFDSPSFYEKLTGKLLVEDIQPSWFIYSEGFRTTNLKRAWKRVLDILFSLVGIILFIPLFPLTAILVKINCPGPLLFKQERVGEGGREFTLYKFRTMCVDAEKDTGAVWASENDPRISRLGGFMRKVRLDEIPQFFNVIKGEMSFIGPRPERKEFVDRLTEKIPYYGKRHFVKPGVTGWAQVRYAYGATDEDALEKLRYDLYYIKNYTFMLDLLIVLETIKVVLFGRGGR